MFCMQTTSTLTGILERWIFEDLKEIKKGNPFFGYKGLGGLCHILRLSMLFWVSCFISERGLCMLLYFFYLPRHKSQFYTSSICFSETHTMDFSREWYLVNHLFHPIWVYSNLSFFLAFYFDGPFLKKTVNSINKSNKFMLISNIIDF